MPAANSPRPRGGKTPIRAVRIDDELWAATQEKAASERRTPADVIRAALIDYVSEAGVVTIPGGRSIAVGAGDTVTRRPTLSSS